jgi:hypothetical protein
LSGTEPDPGHTANEASLSDVLRDCAPSFTPDLAGGDAWTALDAACRRLPATLSTFWGVETRLGDDRPELDVLVEIKRGAPGHALLAGSSAAIDRLCATAETWRALRQFAMTWGDRAHALHGLVRNLWLEFDLVAARASAADALAVPCVFWGPERAPITSGPALMDLLEAVGRAFAPYPRHLPRDLLDPLVRGLPPGARAFQVGAMRLRGDVVLRVCINAIASNAVPAWLGSAGWSGDLDALREELRALDGLVRAIAVDVDVTAAGLGPKLGIECYLDWTNASSDQWIPLLDFLGGARGLCRPAKRRAIARFPQRTDFSISEQLSVSRSGFLSPVLFRNIHHVKLAFVDDRFTEAKAYLGVARPGVSIGQFLDPNAPAAMEDGWYAP